MKFFAERSSEGSVAARAYVVPYDTHNTGENVNNISAGSRARTQMRLVVISAEDGGAIFDRQQPVTASVPNWLRVVLHYAGSNYGPRELPAEIHVPVRIDPQTRAIVEVDVEQAETELAAYRAGATKWWKEDEGPLADVRSAIALPRDAIHGAKGLLGTWRKALSDLREDHGAGGDRAPAHSPAETEQARRTANALKYRLQRNPKQLAKVRASALQAGPMMADGVKGGASSPADFENWLQFQLTSGAITDDEAEEWRRRSHVSREHESDASANRNYAPRASGDPDRARP